MANGDHIQILNRGVEAWNAWRKENGRVAPDLERANLRGWILRKANLSGARLTSADLIDADLYSVDFRGARLDKARLNKANLAKAYMPRAILRNANLCETNLTGAHLVGADLSGSLLSATSLGNANLRHAVGLDQCTHHGPSIVDIRTLRQSWPIPIPFLRGCGLDETFITYLPSLIGTPIQYYSCFISYSAEDEGFARRLHADLQDHGARCWFAPHDMKIGADILDTIDEAIRLRDKVLIIFSASSIASGWVEEEVKKAFSEERGRRKKVVFPLKIDDAIATSHAAWVRSIRENRHVGDFCKWKEHDAYQIAFERLLRDLKMEGDTDA